MDKDQATEEEHLKYIEEITKGKSLSSKDFSNLTKDRKRDLHSLEDEYGKVVKAKQNKPTDSSRERKIPINKYSGNGRLPLHESVIIGNVSKFVYLFPSSGGQNGEIKYEFEDSIETPNATLIPNGTIDTATPLPYIFESTEEFDKYLKLASAESLDSLYIKVDCLMRKYVNVEEYYYPLIVGDTIWSYFQDRFPYTHYLIFTGDNGSGKNSTLLVFRYLGYRVFYVVSASAADYITAMGFKEEGQVTIAEDEVEDLGQDKNKRNMLKSGYASGASVPRVELDGGRKMDNWLVYSHKWLATEEWKYDKYTKGITHRSFKLEFLAGDVPYNIKDVMRFADDPEYKLLHDELINIRKLLFCFRLIHHRDTILNVKLNVKGRTAELVSPLIRLFQHSPLAREKIIDSLSKFLSERSQTISDSFEAKLLESIQSLINARIERSLAPTSEDKALGSYTFTNESIREKLALDTEAQPIPEKKGVFYSAETGAFSQSRITSILKSKFKVDFLKMYINGKQTRCVVFKQVYLDRLKASNDIPNKIEIIEKTDKTLKTFIPSTMPSHTNGLIAQNIENIQKLTTFCENPSQNENHYDVTENPKIIESNKKASHLSSMSCGPKSESNASLVVCSKCGYKDNAYWMKLHSC